MHAIRAHPLPATLFGLCVGVTAAAYLLMTLNWLTPRYQPTSMEIYWFATWPAMFLAYPIVGALIAARQPRNAIGWLFCGLGLLWALGFLAAAYAGFGLKAHPGAVPGAMVADWFESWSFFPGLGLALVYAPLLFPNGRPASPRWRIVAWTGAVGVALTTAVFAFQPGPLDDGVGGFPNPYGILPDPLATALALVGFPLTLGSAIAASTSLGLRLRRARGVERERLKWIAFAGAVLAFAFICHLILQFSGLADRVEWYGALWGMALCGVPIAAGVAIFRLGMFDIDVIIGRTLVYAALTAIVVGGYVAIVAGVGALFQQRGGLLLPLAATGVVAVAFQPLRERLQRGVNRILYGDRDDPYAVLSRLGQRLESALAPDDILPVIVQSMTDALRLPYAAIELAGGAGLPAAAAGSPVDGAIRLPLHYQAEPVGELIVAPRGPGETFGAADQRLLQDLARQIGVAAHAVRLTADLQRSRQRLVTAREEERRRLRRDLHDGLGAQLAALSMQAGALRATIAADPAAAEAQAAELRTELRAAVADIRRLVHGLRPPALDEFGLIGALRERVARAWAPADVGVSEAESEGRPALAVTLLAPGAAPTLPAAIEVAVYRIVEEALVNVSRHAAATSCTIRLAFGGMLELTIEDDGVGLGTSRGLGVGLQSMRERAEELGGTFQIGDRNDGPGARVVVRLPLPAPAEG